MRVFTKVVSSEIVKFGKLVTAINVKWRMISLSILLILSLNGCTSLFVQPISASEKDSGVVMFHSNSYFYATIVGIDESNRDKKYKIGSNWLGAISSKTYIGSLPVGRYKIYKFNGAEGFGPRFNVELKFLTDYEFTIKQNQVTYLGRIISGDFANRGRNIFRTSNVDNLLAKRWVNTYHPELNRLLKNEILNWDAFDDEISNKEYEWLRVADWSPTSMEQLADGSVFIGTALGRAQLWVRESDFRVIGPNFVGRSDIFYEVSNDEWIVAGEYGEISLTRNSGADWERIGEDLPFGIIKGVNSGIGEDVLISIASKGTLSIISLNLGTNKWNLIDKQEFTETSGLGPGFKPKVSEYKEMLYITLPPNKLVRLDMKNYSVVDVSPRARIINIAISGDGVLRCRCVDSIRPEIWESIDNGVSWTKSTLPYERLIPMFWDENLGLAIENKYDSTNHWTELYRSSNGGESWSKISSLERAIIMTNLFEGDNSILAIDIDGKINYSKDTGSSWIQYTNPNRQFDWGR
ncbi:hypothetical protein A9Q99_06170 [Gammaproteobacteria bacterium 45_16_T64]|nr:hypothetical protein A9Q99_06170 [Gammaproteobacteria bacterium 45_16_T64]